MDSTILFGDVFHYRGDEYVYFAQSAQQDIVFAGKILDVANTSRLQAIEKTRQSQNSSTALSPIYSYVVLSTEEFKRRAVLCAEGVANVGQLSYPHANLSSDDITKIKQEIKDGPAPPILKELVELLAG